MNNGLFLIHRGDKLDRTRHVDRAVKLQGARLSKNVPFPVRLRLETKNEVLLLETEVCAFPRVSNRGGNMIRPRFVRAFPAYSESPRGA